VGSDVGGHRELISDGNTGYLFAAGDAGALVKRLAQVMSHPDDAARIAANGRRHVEANLTWDIVSEKYSAIYNELLTKKRTNGPA
jgi:glycogen(starch) synthase